MDVSGWTWVPQHIVRRVLRQQTRNYACFVACIGEGGGGGGAHEPVDVMCNAVVDGKVARMGVGQERWWWWWWWTKLVTRRSFNTALWTCSKARAGRAPHVRLYAFSFANGATKTRVGGYNGCLRGQRLPAAATVTWSVSPPATMRCKWR